MTSAKGGTRLIQNAAANLSRIAAGWLVVLLMPPILVRSLDAPTYSTWMLILQLSAYTSLFESAMQMSTARFVAHSDGLDDRRRMGSMISSSALLLTLLGVLILLVIALGAWKLGAFFPSMPRSILPQARIALVLTASSLAVCLPCSALAGMYVGLQRNEVPALIGATARLSGAAGATWAALHHQGLVAMALWTAAATLLQPLLYLTTRSRSTWAPFLRLAHIGRESVVEFIRFCSATLVSQFGTLLITGLDIPIVAAFDFQSTAFYAVAATFSNMLVVPHGAIISTVMPVAAAVIGDDAHSAQRRGDLLLRISRFANALLCLTTFPLLLGMRPLLTLWVGADYAVHALAVGQLLVIAQFIRLTLLPYAIVGFSAGQQQRMLVSPFVEGIVNLALSLTLVRSLGALGVALGTLAGALIGVTLHFTVSMPRTDAVRFSRTRLLNRCLLAPLAFTAAPIALYFVGIHLSPSPGSRTLLLLAAELLLAASLWLLYFHPDERSYLTSLVQRRLHRAAGRA